MMRLAGRASTSVLVRLTRSIGRPGSCSIHRSMIVAFAEPVANTNRWRAALTAGTVSVIRTRPLYSPDIATAPSAWITGSPGGHDAVWPSSPTPRCTTSSRSGNNRRVSPAS